MGAMRNCTLSLIFIGAVLAGCGGTGTAPLASTTAPGGDVVTRSGGEDNAWVTGPASNINRTARTFSIKRQSGTFPINALVSIKTNSTTRYRMPTGEFVSSTRWFSTLTTGRRVEAEGSKGLGNTLTATKVKIEKD
ncbi:MAG: hypothetical protein QOJ65_1747 [Fimbriimonadaceae bacterium]|nr:hypothetical protein [Fimbriimonadaceae bacterium]